MSYENEIKIIELTSKIPNYKEFIRKIADLEVVVCDKMEEEGRKGQLFTTGYDDILEYVESEENTVMSLIDENNEVLSAAYITQGQKSFTYNDITKYFKCAPEFQDYVKAKYKAKYKDNYNEAYLKDMLSMYKLKLEAFEYAKRKVMEEAKVKYQSEAKDIVELIESEKSENGYHEKSYVRDGLNKYMAEYIEQNHHDSIQLYEDFYWITTDDIIKEYGKDIKPKRSQIELDTALKFGKLTIHEKPKFDERKYYGANTRNSIELDTYISNPNVRGVGNARIIVYEGIKKHMEKCLKAGNEDVFLCSTLHRANFPSKYVSEFFGLTDSMYVERRQGRDREVHICRVSKQDYEEYMRNLQYKLAVLYDYNPENLEINDEIRKQVLKEQLKYEYSEIKRIREISGFRVPDKMERFTGEHSTINRKIKRAQELAKKIREINDRNGWEETEELNEEEKM